MKQFPTSFKSHFESKDVLETDADMIQNHLTPIMAYAELILRGKMGPVSVRQRKKIEVIRSEAKRMNFLLKTFKKEDSSKSAFIKNEIVELELKLALSKKELQEKKRQIKYLKKGKTRPRWMRKEKKPFTNNINSISSQITTVHNQVNKNTRLLAFTVVLSIITVSSFLIFNMDSVNGSTAAIAPFTSKHLIQNLRGDTIDTWISWRLAEGEPLHVNIINSAKLSEENLEIVKNAIISEDTIDIDKSFQHKGPAGTYITYYLGWQGALKSAAKSETKFVVPIKFEFVESSNGVGDIFITLTSLRDADGYTGYTNSLVDDSQNQILKSNITIYRADQLTGNNLTTIIRHEMGHALGLMHSTAPEDLMAPVIQTYYPFISPCDVNAIISLYDGQKSSKVVCEI